MNWEDVEFAVVPGTGTVVLAQYRLSIDEILADVAAAIPFESGLAIQTFGQLLQGETTEPACQRRNARECR